MTCHTTIAAICALCWIWSPQPTLADNTGSSDVNKETARSPSLYEQYCCVNVNRRKAFLLTGRERKYFLCPDATPSSCSSVEFSTSCSSILRSYPSVTSGHYNIALANGSTITVYCDMEGVNCDGEGGWMRVALLDMSDPTQQCPPGFRLYQENGIRACGRQSFGCVPAIFLTYDISYSQVCGRVTGYQKGSPDAFLDSILNLHAAYVDGVSITVGNAKQHIWTLIATKQENGSTSECPCASNSSMEAQPPFVGNAYFCESGAPVTNDDSTLYTDDPLWDGEQCGPMETECCNIAGIPWFNNRLDEPTDDFVELRVCGNEGIENEDSPVSYFEIYTK